MKTLEIPYLPELDLLNIENAATLMEEKASRNSIDTLNWPNEFAYHPITVFDIARSDEYIYISFFVRGNFLRAVTYKDNEYVYTDSCVEFFVRKEEDEHYYNLEFNCIGTAYAAYGSGRNGRTLLPTEELKRIKRYASPGNRPFEEMEGLFSWEVVFAIPYDLIGLDKHNLPDSLRANFYKCADASSLPHYLSWNPIQTEHPDFHRPEFFGRMILGK